MERITTLTKRNACETNETKSSMYMPSGQCHLHLLRRIFLLFSQRLLTSISQLQIVNTSHTVCVLCYVFYHALYLWKFNKLLLCKCQRQENRSPFMPTVHDNVHLACEQNKHTQHWENNDIGLNSSGWCCWWWWCHQP